MGKLFLLNYFTVQSALPICGSLINRDRKLLQKHNVSTWNTCTLFLKVVLNNTEYKSFTWHLQTVWDIIMIDLKII